jgi:hypothetical protein
MYRKWKIAVAALVALVGATVQAATINTSASVLNGNNLTDLSTGGLLSFDLDVVNTNQLALSIDLSSADLSAGSIAWNALFTNLSPASFTTYAVQIAGATISFIGDLTDTFQTPLSGLSTTATSAFITFPGTGEAAGFELGNPLGFTSNDWQLSGFTGSSITVYLQANAVPEPSLAALLLLGAAFGTLRLRRAH